MLRQLGQLMRRLGGERRLDRATSLEVGDVLPEVLRVPSNATRRLILFVSPTCGICSEVLTGLSRLVPDRSQLILVLQAPPATLGRSTPCFAANRISHPCSLIPT